MNSKALLLLIGVGATSLAYAADTRFGINIRIGPPAPVVVREAPPPPIVVEEHEHGHRMAAPGPGYVWIPRHHRWVDGRWERIEGQWVMPPQPDAHWVEGRWDRQSQTWTDEHWEVTTTTSYATAPGYPQSPPPAYSQPPPPPAVYGQSEPTYSTAPYPGEAEIALEVAPPPPRREVVPARPSRRHVWVAGYWAAEHGRHEWVSGHWEVPPEGHSAWVAPRWENRGRSYVFVRGYWK